MVYLGFAAVNKSREATDTVVQGVKRIPDLKAEKDIPGLFTLAAKNVSGLDLLTDDTTNIISYKPDKDDYIIIQCSGPVINSISFYFFSRPPPEALLHNIYQG